MKKLVLVKLLIVTLLVTSLGSCSVHVHRRTTVVHKHKYKPLPPGHAKKLHGEKSAKNYTKKRRH
ncbi:hypothetical protein SAMN05444005_10822 [Flavobacterium urocaniciphilum]|uniref:Quinol oxidase subunit 4 n=1 Tax=Flavobacterium urocaniciphilum TaxID=1299341 RepID=A0A1H9DR48_9FLAO|nr:hypothetical protein SAMN05444005_10822 [Flavobacterium urocaniciphilum]